MTVGQISAFTTVQDVASELVDLLDGADVFTDAEEKTSTVNRIRSLCRSLRSQLEDDRVLVVLAPSDLEALASGAVPTWLAAASQDLVTSRERNGTAPGHAAAREPDTFVIEYHYDDGDIGAYESNTLDDDHPHIAALWDMFSPEALKAHATNDIDTHRPKSIVVRRPTEHETRLLNAPYFCPACSAERKPCVISRPCRIPAHRESHLR